MKLGINITHFRSWYKCVRNAIHLCVDMDSRYCTIICPYLSVIRLQKNLKTKASALFLLKLALYAMRNSVPPTFGSGGQRRPLYQSLFLLSLKPFLFFSGAIWVRKCLRKGAYICRNVWV